MISANVELTSAEAHAALNAGHGGAPRSDATTLHVDFEDATGGVFMNVLNAGVRWLGDPFSNIKQGEVEIVTDASQAFAGVRAAHVRTVEPDQRARIVLQRRFDAAEPGPEIVAEFVFRPAASSAADLHNLVAWSTQRYTGGGPSGLTLYASGSAERATFDVAVEDARGPDARITVATGLSQTHWLRFILHKRSGGTVDLWLGPPGQESRVGSFEDNDPNGDWGRVEIGDVSAGEGYGSGFWDDVRIGNALAPGAEVTPAEKRRDVSVEEHQTRLPVKVGRERQLFVDDTLVQSQQGLSRSFHSVHKHAGNPLMVPDRAWEKDSNCILPLSVHREPASGQFRMWYGIWGKQVGKPTFEGYATSADGIEWEKPNLGLVAFNGSTENNIVREGRMFRVVPHADEQDPEKRYKAAIRDAGFLAAYSPDGLRWTTTTQILDQSLDATSVHWDPVGKKWIASCKIFWNGVRARGYAESTDFEKWTDTYFMLAADERDGPQDQIYAMDIARYESIYVGLLKMYHLDTDRCDIQIAFSRNGRHWQRPERSPFIPNSSEPQAWDYGNIDVCTGNPIVMEDHLRFYYSGRSTLHNDLPNDGRMGLATLRRDGFASMDADDSGGVLVTQPLKLAGNTLYVNADAAGGEIHVEVLEDVVRDTRADEADVPIFPFLKDRCEPILSDGLSYPVKWRSSPGSLRSLGNRAVRLRFYLRHAKLYSFWVE